MTRQAATVDAMKKRILTIWLACLCLTLCGCGDRLLERSYSSAVPHSAVFWENEDADTLRAENYQDLVNALLLLLGEHSEDGVVRIYGDHPDREAMAGAACVEVQKETAIGAYLLDYITYDGKAESAYYELKVRFGYRRTAEEQAAIVNATGTEVLPDLLRAAIDEGRGAVAVRVSWFGSGREGVMALVSAVHDEVFPPEPEPEPDEPAAGAAEGEAPPDGETPPDAAETLAAEEPPAEGEAHAAGEDRAPETETAAGETPDGEPAFFCLP